MTMLAGVVPPTPANLEPPLDKGDTGRGKGGRRVKWVAMRVERVDKAHEGSGVGGSGGC